MVCTSLCLLHTTPSAVSFLIMHRNIFSTPSEKTSNNSFNKLFCQLVYLILSSCMADVEVFAECSLPLTCCCFKKFYNSVNTSMCALLLREFMIGPCSCPLVHIVHDCMRNIFLASFLFIRKHGVTECGLSNFKLMFTHCVMVCDQCLQ